MTFCLFLFLLFATCATSLHDIIRLEDSNQTYILQHDVVRPITDSITLDILVSPHIDKKSTNDRLRAIKTVNATIFQQYRIGEAVQIAIFNGSAADLVRADREKIALLQDKLYHSHIPIGHYMNPSIVKWNHRYLLANAMTWGFYEGKRVAKGRMLFRWLNISSTSYDSNEPYLCTSSNNHSQKIPYISSGEYHPFYSFKVEDPRLMVMNASWIHIVFSIMSPKHITVGTVNLIINPLSNCAELKHFKLLRYDQEVKKTQKNWSPFLYDDKILYIQTINPMNVVDYAGYNITYRHTHFDMMTDVSHVPYNPNVSWAYGDDIRGGSNCLRVNDVEYVSFFHSYRYSNVTGSKTYVLGAYTFSANPPFHVLRMSSLPIFYDDTFYSGDIHVKHKTWHIDYVVFPMTISFVEDDNNHNSEEILLSFGHQDSTGWLARFRVDELLSSLEIIAWPEQMIPYYDHCNVSLNDRYRNSNGRLIYFKPYYYCSDLKKNL